MDEATLRTFEIVDKTLELSAKQMEFVDQIDGHVKKFFESMNVDSEEKALKTTPKKFTKRLAL